MANRLADETSPYLLQHAENPVEWHPWGENALAKAREEERPILLSIGYSACHWCHVMAHESFEDDEVAELMNEAFVNVKVDREERPDVDAVYMRAVQALTGRGGWPLTVFLTPDGTPYYGGTYFPPEPRGGMPSFRQVLEAARDAWEHRRDDVRRAAGELRSALERLGAYGDGRAQALSPTLPDRAYRSLADRYDPAHGGFGRAPKFPQPPTLEFLLRYHRWTRDRAPDATGEDGGSGNADGHGGGPEAGEEERASGEGRRRAGTRALEMVTHTLRRMARGGIRDHLGGGFHRYSVDARWLVPHFEKMLYDNALLARLYVQAWQITGDEELRDGATSTLDWLLEDMRDRAGGFYAARDADSEGEEGRYYVWTLDEVEEALGDEDADSFRRIYDVSEGGNFEGRNILHLPHDLEAVARGRETDPEELKARLAEARQRLLEIRRKREAPLRDEKVLAGWNGMTLRALAEAGGALRRDDYLEAAVQGMDFVLDAMRTGAEGSRRLLHVWTAGEARIEAFLEDWASVGNALLTLYEVTLEPRWLPEVRWACDGVLERFRDPESGLFYDTAEGTEELVVRPRETMDNATPAGTSLAVELLLRAGHLFGEEAWTAAAVDVLERASSSMERHPSAFGRLLSQVVSRLEAPVEVALVGPREHEDARTLRNALLRRYLPNRTVAGREPGETLPVEIPLLEGRETRDGRPTAYVCRNFTCREPVTDTEGLEEELERL